MALLRGGTTKISSKSEVQQQSSRLHHVCRSFLFLAVETLNDVRGLTSKARGQRQQVHQGGTKILAAVLTRPAMNPGQPDLDARHKSSLPSPGAHLLLLAVSLAPLVLPVHANALIILTASLTVWVGSCRSIKPEPPSESMTKQVERLEPQKH